MSGISPPVAFNPNHLDEGAIVRALAEGEHAPVLQAFFGEPLYAQLAPLARQAQQAKSDPETVVCLLPGLLGSRLGARTQRGNEWLWLEPSAVIGGKLVQLAMGRRRSLQPMGMMLPGYLLLKLALQAAGFRVQVHAYDWRRSIVDLGRQLAQTWLHEPARNIMVVGHSMGGLVARAALRHPAGARVGRVVQIGTPNSGSWALMQVLRAAYPTVRKLGAVDRQHSAEDLVRMVFHGFCSFYEMLPRPEQQPHAWLDARYWPDDELRPLPDRFRFARRLPRYLAAADQRCHAIVGVGQQTPCGAKYDGKELLFDYAHNGDGTVPMAFAQWSGASHWYVAGRHGLLPQHPDVRAGVIDLLRGATTSRLPATPMTQSTTVTVQRESELRAVLRGKVRWDHLPMSERRELLEPIISEAFVRACQI